MKPSPTKSDIRAEIETQIATFLGRGGEVEQVSMGATGIRNGKATPNIIFEGTNQERTPVPEVVAAIESRRQAKLTKNKAKPHRHQRPKKKVIYDDFGEPIRIVWVET